MSNINYRRSGPVWLVTLLTILIGSIPVLAQDYQVEFLIIPGGAGNMSGTLSTGESTITGNVSIIVDQPIISTETMVGNGYKVDLGFWSSMLRTPGTPIVTATYDVYPDKVRVDWRYDPNDPPGTSTHLIYRDYSTNNNPIAELLAGVRSFEDDDLPAGEQYEYLIQGSNRIQSAASFQPLDDAGFAFGKTSSDGAISGFIQTTLGSNIKDAKVRVMNEAGVGPAWGSSVYLNGTQEQITIPQNDIYEFFDQTINDGTTMELWFNPAQITSNSLLSKGYDWELSLEAAGLNYLSFTMGGEPIFATDNNLGVDDDQGIAVDKWNHIALVRSGQILKVYINGWLARINNGQLECILPQMVAGVDNLVIGAGSVQNYSGLIDEFRVWDEARDEMFREPFSDINGNDSLDVGTEFFTDINGDGEWGDSDSTRIRRDYDRLYNRVAEGVVIEPNLVACFHMNIGSDRQILDMEQVSPLCSWTF